MYPEQQSLQTNFEEVMDVDEAVSNASAAKTFYAQGPPKRDSNTGETDVYNTPRHVVLILLQHLPPPSSDFFIWDPMAGKEILLNALL